MKIEKQYRALYNPTLEGLLIHQNGKLLDVNEALAGMCESDED